MTPLLLDTNAFLWFIFDDPRLSERAVEAIDAADTEPVLSVVSLWEITIKRQLGRLDLGMTLQRFLRLYVEQRRLTVLGIELSDLLAYDQLPLLHRDPFDRLLVAQAKTLGGRIVSADQKMRDYDLDVVW